MSKSEQEVKEEFERWWHDEGSGMAPEQGEDAETHTHRVAYIAWANRAFKGDQWKPANIQTRYSQTFS